MHIEFQQDDVLGTKKLSGQTLFLFFLFFLFTSSRCSAEPSLSLATLKERSAKLASSVLDVDALRQAVQFCEQILAEKPDDFETLVLLSRVCWSLGNHEENVKKQKEWFDRGQKLANKAKMLCPDKPDGHYWHGINYGEWVDRSSIFSKIGAKRIILQDMEKVLALNPKYDGGGAYIVIGRINYLSPGGSYSKAIEYFEKSISLNPRRTTAYLYLGELYLHEHVFDKAEKALKKVLAMEIDPRFAIEARNDRKMAERLIKKLNKKESRFPEQNSIREQSIPQ